MPRLLLPLFIILVLLGYSGFTQSEKFYSSVRTSWKLPYTHSYSQKQNFGNYIMEELAKDLLQPPRFVNVSVGFKCELSLEPTKQGTFFAIAGLSDLVLSGNLQYRSFPVKDVMTPSSVKFSLKSSAKLDTSDYKVRVFEGPLNGDPPHVNFKAEISAPDTTSDTLTCSGFSFFYSEQDWQRFYARKSLIDDYYASVAIMDSLLMESATWDMRDPSQLAFNYIRLSELVKVLDLVSDRDFGNTLISKGGDKSRLLEKHLALYKVSRTCLYNLSETIEQAGTPGVALSAESISNYFIERLMRYVRLSSLMESIHGRIYQDYLRTFFAGHVYDNDADVIRSVLVKMFPDASPDTILSWASESLMQAYRRKAQELISENRYSDAVLLIENSKSMAKVNSFLKDSNGWEKIMATAVNGIYNSFAGIASSSLSGGNLNFAMEYLQKAEEYREQYPQYISSDSIYRRVYRSIFVGQLEHCNSLLETGNYSDALYCLQSCETSYKGRILEILQPDINTKKVMALNGLINGLAGRSRKALKNNMADSALIYFDAAMKFAVELPTGTGNGSELDSLAPPIARIRVKKINTLAFAYFNHLQFSRAILQFEQAGKISAVFSIPSDRAADSVCRLAFKQWLLDRISQEQRLIWNDKPDSARNFIRLALETAKSKGLDQDPVILKAVSDFNSGIRSYACGIMQDSIALYNIRAGRCFSMNNYMRGVRILRYTLYRAGLMQGCHFELGPVMDSIKKYIDAANYQENLDSVNTNMTTGEYLQGLRILAANQELYSMKRIDHFGIPLISVYDYIISKANPFISMQALEYYMNLGDPMEALRYLSLLHLQGLPADRSDTYQEKLAQMLASKDKLAYGNADPQNIVRRYSATNAWMGRFTEVYIREWKK